MLRCSSPDVGVDGALVRQLRVLLVEAQDARPPRAAAAPAGRLRLQHRPLVLVVQLPMGELHVRVFLQGSIMHSVHKSNLNQGAVGRNMCHKLTVVKTVNRNAASEEKKDDLK